MSTEVNRAQGLRRASVTVWTPTPHPASSTALPGGYQESVVQQVGQRTRLIRQPLVLPLTVTVHVAVAHGPTQAHAAWRWSAVLWHYVYAASRNGSDQAFGSQDVEGLLGGALGDFVALHDRLDARQGLARADLPRLDHPSQERSYLQVARLVAEMINRHPARLSNQG